MKTDQPKIFISIFSENNKFQDSLMFKTWETKFVAYAKI